MSEDAQPTILAGALADHVEMMIIAHGDLPLDQWDHDTWSTLGTPPDFVSLQERPDEVQGPVLVVSSMGYVSDEDPIVASAFVAGLRTAIARHGDLPVHHHDSDTMMLLPYREQQPEVRKGAILITSVGYTEL